MKAHKITIIATFILVAILLTQCALFVTGRATVTIDLGGNTSGVSQSIFSRALAPSSIEGYTLTITGPDMDPIVKSFGTGTLVISLSVPAGPNRKFELEANLNPLAVPDSPLFSFMGTERSDLAPNEVKAIRLKMIPGRTKLLVPDWYNRRLVQIDDLSGALYPEYRPLDLPGLPALYAADIDLDAKGRIYIASYYDSFSSLYYILRIDDYKGTNAVYYPISYLADAIAVDKYYNYVYFSSGGNSVWRFKIPDVDTSAVFVEEIDLNELGIDGLGITGIDVDRDGLVYLASNTYIPQVIKIDPGKPVGSRVVEKYSDPGLTTPYDVVIKDEYVYVSNQAGGNIYKLLASNLKLVNIAGTLNTPSLPAPINPPVGEFFGPERFIAITNKKLTLIDEVTIMPFGYNRLVEFDDIDWSGLLARENPADNFLFLDFY